MLGMMPSSMHALQVQSQAQDFASNVQTQANAFVESQARDIRDEVLGEIDRLQHRADRFGGPIYSKRRRIMGHNAPCDDVTMIVCSTIVYNRGAMLQAP